MRITIEQAQAALEADPFAVVALITDGGVIGKIVLLTNVANGLADLLEEMEGIGTEYKSSVVTYLLHLRWHEAQQDIAAHWEIEAYELMSVEPFAE
jgi:hypothetical protein